MMAEKQQVSTYENPLTIIDTESSKIWGDAIENFGTVLGQTFQKLEQTRSAEAKEIQEQQSADIRNFLSNEQKAYEITSKLATPNESLTNLVANALDYRTKAQLAAERAKTPEDIKYWTNETLRATRTLREAKDLIPMINTGKADFIQDAYSGDEEGKFGFNTVGKEGGISLIGGQNQSFFEGMRVATNLSEGNVEFYNAEDGGINVKITGGTRTDITPGGAANIDTNASEWFAYDMGEVEPVGENFIKVAQQIGLIGNDDQISEDYLTTNPDAMKIMLTPSNNKGYNVKTTIVPYDQAKILQSSKKLIEAQADAVMMDYKMANNVWRNLFTEFCDKGDENCKYHKDLKPDGKNGSLLNKEQRVEFMEAYMKYVKQKYIPNYKIIKVEEIQEDGSIKTSQQEYIGEDLKDLDGDGKISQDEVNQAKLAKRTSSFVKKGKEEGGGEENTPKSIAANTISNFADDIIKNLNEEEIAYIQNPDNKSGLPQFETFVNRIIADPLLLRSFDTGLKGGELDKLRKDIGIAIKEGDAFDKIPSAQWGSEEARLTNTEVWMRFLENLPTIKKAKLTSTELRKILDNVFKEMQDSESFKIQEQKSQLKNAIKKDEQGNIKGGPSGRRGSGHRRNSRGAPETKGGE